MVSRRWLDGAEGCPAWQQLLELAIAVPLCNIDCTKLYKKNLSFDHAGSGLNNKYGQKYLVYVFRLSHPIIATHGHSLYRQLNLEGL